MTTGTTRCQVVGNTVRLSGELDIATVGDVESALSNALRTSAPDVIVDVSGTTFVDSATITALVGARVAAGRIGRAVRLRGVGPRFERLLGLYAPQPPFDVVA